MDLLSEAFYLVSLTLASHLGGESMREGRLPTPYTCALSGDAAEFEAFYETHVEVRPCYTTCIEFFGAFSRAR